MKHFIAIVLICINFLTGFSHNNLVKYTGDVEHIFSHCLLAYPELALSESNSMKKHYETDCITKNEFKKILDQLYQNDYILVDINSTFQVDKNGKATKKTLYLPKNKKPLILSFDDVNYDRKKLGKGMVDKIIVDKNNKLATQTNINGKIEISYDNEFVTILDSFVYSHPDFSFKGVKATINLTGYDGILGYRTNSGNKLNRQEEIAQAKKVVSALKKSGYNFASHSYGHYHMKKISDFKFEEELKLWKNEVEPLVGKTEIYVYPYGEWVIDENNEISYKHKLLEKYGFKLFCGVGMQPFFSYLPFSSKISEKCLFMDRKSIDGYSLKNRTTQLAELFNCSYVRDKLRYI